MADAVKFSDEELKGITNVRNMYTQLKNQLGELQVQRILIEAQLDALEKAESDTQEKYKQALQTEQQLVIDLDKKYGRGNLDMESGVFTPFQN